jgi:hypothetical protein
LQFGGMRVFISIHVSRIKGDELQDLKETIWNPLYDNQTGDDVRDASRKTGFVIIAFLFDVCLYRSTILHSP